MRTLCAALLVLASGAGAAGAEGWELVAVINQSYRRNTDPTVLYGYTILTYHFKKPIEADNPSPLP